MMELDGQQTEAEEEQSEDMATVLRRIKREVCELFERNKISPFKNILFI
jgi:hypothetical protein